MDLWLLFLGVFAMGLVVLPAIAVMTGDPHPPRPPRKKRPF